MTEPSIRLLDSQDAAEYQRLRLAALATDPEAFLSTLESEKARSQHRFGLELHYAKLLSPFGYYGVFDGPKLIGYLQVACPDLEKQRHIGFVYNVYLDANYRHQGLTTRLFRFVTERLASVGVERLFVECVASNVPAMHFYQSLGFVECGRKTQSVKWQGQYDDQAMLTYRLETDIITQSTGR